jgi:transcriptional regulator with GAF, ATPase, and Fis domain
MSRDDARFQSTHPNAPASGCSDPEQVMTIVYPDDLAGQCVALYPGLMLGRSPDDGVTSIFHPTISRRHAAVSSGLGGLLCLADLSSRNGTRVNGKQPKLPVPLAAQSVVRLGDVLGIIDQRGEGRFGDDPVLPGTSNRIVQLRQELARAASDPAPLLIIGETGTGKERLAKEVHARSERTGPYLALNCAELSPQLVESELFGHERGAFTGAVAAKTGVFVAAHGGTLFLDEIGELPLDLQAKLLRALQEGEVRPVGSTKTVRVDVRIVAATNRDLPALVEQNQFRRDLYARLSLWELRLPPLRERRQDILPWAKLLLSVWNAERDTATQFQLLPDAAERVLLHDWLDNLRGLNRMVHRLGSLALERPFSLRALIEALPELAQPSDTLSADDEGAAVPEGAPAGMRQATGSTVPPQPAHTPAPAAPRPSREEFLALYESLGRSVRATAKHLGKDRRQIYRWLEAFGIARDPEAD